MEDIPLGRFGFALQHYELISYLKVQQVNLICSGSNGRLEILGIFFYKVVDEDNIIKSCVKIVKKKFIYSNMHSCLA